MFMTRPLGKRLKAAVTKRGPLNFAGKRPEVPTEALRGALGFIQNPMEGTMSRSSIAVVVMCCLLAASFTAMAQTTGNIRGVVTDETGAVLPSATVTIYSEALIGGSRSAVTNTLGVYRFPSLAVGIYAVEVSMDGFQTFRMENVEVNLNSTVSVNVNLKLATVVETVTVVGESPVVDVTSSKVQHRFGGEMVQDVPSSRNFYDFIQFAPGMSAVGEGGTTDRTVAFGSNQQSNSWTIDGIETSAPETGSAWWYVQPDMVEEVEVMGVGAPAEFGNPTGGVFNVVTKKGGDDFHGGANFFFQHDSLTGTNVEVDGFGFKRDAYRDLTAQLGGPIVPERVWFFGSYRHNRDSATQPGVDPQFAGADLSRSDMYDIKVTAKLGERHEIGGLFHYEDWGFIGGGSANVAPSAADVERGSNPAWGANLTSIFSENTLFEARYAGWWSDDIHDSPTGSFETPFFDYTPPGGGPITYSGGVYYPWDYTTWSEQFNAKVTHYSEDFLASQHEFKFGVQFAKGSAKTNVSAGPNGFYEYSYYGYLYRGYQDPYQYGGVSRDLGIFVDDNVTVNEHLTLNLGVRVDLNRGTIPDYERLAVGEPSIAVALNAVSTGETVPGVKNLINWNLISPRIGFALQPGDSGRSVIKGFFGVFYDQNVIGNWDAPAPGLPDFEIFTYDPVLGRGDLIFDITASDIAFHPNLRPPQTMQATVGFDQQLGDNLSASVQYVYKDTKDLIGWEVLDGVYEPLPFEDPFTGDVLTLFNEVEAPTLRKGNRPGNFPGGEDLKYEQDYHGVVLTLNKRFANNWGLMASYAWSKSEGLIPRPWFQTQNNPFYGSQTGIDPNNYFNSFQRLQADRPHSFRLFGLFELPGDFVVAPALNLESGRPFNRQIQAFGLNQGSTRVILETAGSRDELRREANKNIDIMVGKRVRIGGATLKFDATVYNILNSDNVTFFQDLRLSSPDETFEPDEWVPPRRLMIRLGFDF
jgi:hypothetical protein